MAEQWIGGPGNRGDRETEGGSVRATMSTIEVLAEGRRAFVDLTDDIRRAIKDSGVTTGCVVAFCSHTTACLVVNEWEDGALEDLRTRLEARGPSDVY